MPDLKKIERKILRGNKITETIGKFDWKDFEKIISDIFRQNDFIVKNNFRFKTGRRWENDLIAVRSNLVFCVDCKRWSDGREKRWDLAKAAKEQQKRTRELEKFVKLNPIARNIMGISIDSFVSMIVTLHEENILKQGKTYVVPVNKLNSFILNFEFII